MSQAELMNLYQTESFMQTTEVVAVVAIALVSILFGVASFMEKKPVDAVMRPEDKANEDEKDKRRKMIAGGAVILGLTILYFYWSRIQQFFY